MRVRELAAPQLFAPSGINQFNPLGLPTTRTAEPPVFLLDLNVLFDVGPRRPRHAEFESLCQAERMNYCRLAISSEAREELKRHAPEQRTDPMQAYIATFPTFPLSALGGQTDSLSKELDEIVFGPRGDVSMTMNDRSDIAHIATAVEHNLAGLITNDEALLNAAPRLQSRFGIRIVSSAAFAAVGDAAAPSTSIEISRSTFTVRQVDDADLPAIHSLLRSVGLSGSAIASHWLPTTGSARVSTRMGAWRGSSLLGFLTWPMWTADPSIHGRAAVDERDSDCRYAARALLLQLIDRVAGRAPCSITLEHPTQQAILREAAFGFGFSGNPGSDAMLKVVDGGVWTTRNWRAKQQSLTLTASIKLPDEPVNFRNIEQHVPVLTPDGNQAHVSLFVLETLLAPTLFAFGNRPAVITPIQRRFAEPLLGHSPQAQLLPEVSASLFAQKTFVSSAQSIKHLARGTLILFYESSKQNGRAALVAIARVRTSFLRNADLLSANDLEPSVLTSHTLGSIGTSKQKTVTIFDSLFSLPNEVPLTKLVELGCGRPNDLITTHPIKSSQLEAILKIAFP